MILCYIYFDCGHETRIKGDNVSIMLEEESELRAG